MVLWPQVIDAVAPTPVLAAGGIGNGRQICGCARRWGPRVSGPARSGSRSRRPTTPPAQIESYAGPRASDTVRSRGLDRQAVPHAPQRLDRGLGTRTTLPITLGMPLQGMMAVEASPWPCTNRYPDKSAKDVAVQPGRPDRRRHERVDAGARADRQPGRAVPGCRGAAREARARERADRLTASSAGPRAR